MLAAAALLTPWSAQAFDGQTPEDRSDAAVITEEERQEAPAPHEVSAGPAVAAEENDVTASVQGLVAGAIRIDGATALPPAAFASAVEPYLGRPLSPSDLGALAREVADVARRAGFGLATAWIPQQNVTNGILRVRIDEGRIDAVEASGPAAAAVERMLARLVDGAPVKTAELERQLLLAGDMAGVSLGRARLARSGGRNILRVETASERFTGRASLDNWGTSAVGPLRARLSADVNSVLTFGDTVSLGAVLTPANPREFQMVQAGYSMPVSDRGTLAAVRGYLSRSRAGAELRDRDIEGDSADFELGLSHPIVRSRAESLWAHLYLGLRDSSLTRTNLEIRNDRIVTATGIVYGVSRFAGGTSRVRLSVVQGLDLLDATRQGAPLASRVDGDGVFTKLSFWTDHTRPLGGGFSVQLGVEGQLASRPLLASEEMGLGGRSFLRGYDYREFAGDRGAAGYAELRFDLKDMPRPIRRAQLYAYGDAGRVSNLRNGQGGGSLASIGGGLRVTVDPRIEAGIEVGVPLRDGAIGNRPDPRISFTLSTRF